MLDRASLVQLFKYLVVGAANTLLGYAIIFACMYLLGLGAELSNLIGYALGLVVSYLMHRNFTFESTQARRAEALRFVAVFAVAYLLNLGALMLLIHRLHVHEGVAQVVAGIVYIGGSFLMQKFYVFRQRAA
ncbi:MAG: GtrA family protein [Gammaproteobacteria bacterium]